MTPEKAVLFGKAIGDMTRQKIIKFCCCTERSVGEITEHVKLRQPTVTHHLNILQKAELTTRREEGKMAYYLTNQESIVSCCGNLLLKIAPNQKEAHKLCKCR
jgi:ArsR family transcriptional regulator